MNHDRSRTALVLLTGATLLLGCHSLPPFLGGGGRPVDARARNHLERARRLVQAEEWEEARLELARAIEREPLYVQAHRLLQEVGIALLEKARLLREWDARLAAAPDVPEMHYLRGRLAAEPAEQRAYFERALELDSDFAWGYYGLGVLAMLDRDDGRAEELFDAALERAPGTVEMVLGKAQVLLRRAAFDQARAWLEEARRLDPEDVRYVLALVAVEVERQEYDEAYRFALEALRTDPGGAASYDILGTFVEERSEHVVPKELEDTLIEVAETLRGDPRTPRGVIARWQRLGGDSARLLGQWENAVLRYRRALQSGAHAFEIATGLRIALVHAGLYLEALERFEETLPEHLIDHPENLLRERFEALASVSRAVQERPTGEKLLALAEAYRNVGWLDEAVVCAARAELLDESLSSQGLSLRLEVQRFERFLRTTRQRILQGYRSGESPSLEPVVREVERIGSLILGEDVGKSKIESLSFFAERVDPVTYDRGVPRFFAHFGRFAMLGRLFQSPIEFYAMRQMHTRVLEGRILGRSYRGVTVVGEGREIPARAELLGGGVAGAAVYEGYFLNLDVVRDWCLDLLAIARRVPEPERHLWLEETLPACPPERRTDLHEPLHVAERLFFRALEREGGTLEARGLLTRLLEVVAVHERAHLADAHEFLPLGRNFLRVFWVLIEEGFSAFAVQARLEMRAELATLAAARESDLVLAHVVSYLETNRSSAHGEGFETILERFVAYLDENLEAFPSLRPDRYLVQQLHLLSREEIRAVARELARAEGLVEE